MEHDPSADRLPEQPHAVLERPWDYEVIELRIELRLKQLTMRLCKGTEVITLLFSGVHQLAIDEGYNGNARCSRLAFQGKSLSLLGTSDPMPSRNLKFLLFWCAIGVAWIAYDISHYLLWNGFLRQQRQMPAFLLQLAITAIALVLALLGWVGARGAAPTAMLLGIVTLFYAANSFGLVTKILPFEAIAYLAPTFLAPLGMAGQILILATPVAAFIAASRCSHVDQNRAA